MLAWLAKAWTRARDPGRGLGGLARSLPSARTRRSRRGLLSIVRGVLAWPRKQTPAPRLLPLAVSSEMNQALVRLQTMITRLDQDGQELARAVGANADSSRLIALARRAVVSWLDAILAYHGLAFGHVTLYSMIRQARVVMLTKRAEMLALLESLSRVKMTDAEFGTVLALYNRVETADLLESVFTA